MKRLTALAVFVLLVESFVEAAPTSIIIINNTGYEIEELYLVPSGWDNWGNDWIPGTTIPDGGKLNLTVPEEMRAESSFHLYAVDVDGDSYVMEEIDLGATNTITITFDHYIDPEEGDAYDEGYAAGFEEGRREGFKEGYAQGYQDGLKKASGR